MLFASILHPRCHHHFFCDLPPLLSLVCADTSLNKWVVFVVAGAEGVYSGLTVLGSSTNILIPILKIRSADGRCEASSTALHAGQPCLSCMALFSLVMSGLVPALPGSRQSGVCGLHCRHPHVEPTYLLLEE